MAASSFAMNEVNGIRQACVGFGALDSRETCSFRGWKPHSQAACNGTRKAASPAGSGDVLEARPRHRPHRHTHANFALQSAAGCHPAAALTGGDKFLGLAALATAPWPPLP